MLHADHEQNCSTSTVRIVGSSQANLFASCAAGVCALGAAARRGERRGAGDARGDPEGGDDGRASAGASKDKSSGFKLMGFGHRVYKNFDPRAVILKSAADEC